MNTMEKYIIRGTAIRHFTATTAQKRKLETVTDSVKRQKLCSLLTQGEISEVKYNGNATSVNKTEPKVSGAKNPTWSLVTKQSSLAHFSAKDTTKVVKRKNNRTSKVTSEKQSRSGPVVHSPSGSHTKWEESWNTPVRECSDTANFADDEASLSSDILKDARKREKTCGTLSRPEVREQVNKNLYPIFVSKSKDTVASKSKTSSASNQTCSPATKQSSIINFSSDNTANLSNTMAVQKRDLNTAEDSIERGKICDFSSISEGLQQEKLYPIFTSTVKRSTASSSKSGIITSPVNNRTRSSSGEVFSIANQSKNKHKLEYKSPSMVTRKTTSLTLARPLVYNRTKSEERRKIVPRTKSKTSSFSEDKENFSSDYETCNPVTTTKARSGYLTSNSLTSSTCLDEFCFPKFSHCRQIRETDCRFIGSKTQSTIINDAVHQDVSVPKWTGFKVLLDNSFQARKSRSSFGTVSIETKECIPVPQWTGIIGLLDSSVSVKNGHFELNVPPNETERKSEEPLYNPGSASSLDDLMWTDKYEAERLSSVRDNPSVLELRKWLLEWKFKFAAKNGHLKTARSGDSSESEDDQLENCVLLIGQFGCGKTSLVYSLADELGYKILEVNASSCRSGRHIQSRLREAFQSHHVGAPSPSFNSQHNEKEDRTGGNSKIRKSENRTTMNETTFFSSKNNITNSFEEQYNSLDSDVEFSHIRKMVQEKSLNLSMILFDDVDIVLDGDYGFWSTVNIFLKTSRKPVVLTAGRNLQTVISHLTVPHKLIKMENPVRSEVVKILNQQQSSISSQLVPVYNSDDIRRCLLSFQFWSTQVCRESSKCRNTFNNFCSSNVLQNSECIADLQSALFSDRPLTILNGIVDHLSLGFDLLHDNLFACLGNLRGLPTSSTFKHTASENAPEMYDDATYISKSKRSINIKRKDMSTDTPKEDSSKPGHISVTAMLSDFSDLLENFSYSDCIEGRLKGSSCSLQAAERTKQWSCGNPVCVDDKFSSSEDFIRETASVMKILSVHHAKRLSEMSFFPPEVSVTAEKPLRLEFYSREVGDCKRMMHCMKSVIPLSQQLNSRAIVLDYASSLKLI